GGARAHPHATARRRDPRSRDAETHRPRGALGASARGAPDRGRDLQLRRRGARARARRGRGRVPDKGRATEGPGGGCPPRRRTAFLWGVTGHERGEPVLTIGGNGVGVIALVGIGAGFGAMRLLRGRFDSRDRRVEALVESGLFVGAGGPQLLEIAADAARQVI